MVDYKYKDLFWKSHIDKQLNITTDDGSVTFTNKDINWESFELSEILVDNDGLKFGSCKHGTVKFKTSNTFISLAGKWLTVTETLENYTDTPIQLGRYKVFSDVPTADRRYRDITAYDAMYDILETDITQWYNNILPNTNTKLTLKQFRSNFISYFHLQQEDITLVNDSMIIERTLEPEQISGKDVITAICEINGCFGHIGRDGKFHYIYLPQDIQGLYPSNTLYPDHAPEWLIQSETGHLYPQDPKSTKLGNGIYINCKYEDFICKKIDKIQIKQQEDDIGCIYGEGNNSYVIVDNFLIYGKGSEELQEISKNIFDKITNIVYRPFSAECVGNPCLEVGDPIRFSTKYKLIESYILKRTLKGIQGLRDTYEATGTENRCEKINSVQRSITQLKGKTNILTRNVDETRSEIAAFEKNVNDNYSTTSEMRSEIKQTADNITQTVSKTYETKENAGITKNELSSKIDQTADSITLTVASSTSKYDIGNREVEYYGYGEPEGKEYLNNAPHGSHYLDQSNGKYYLKMLNDWVYLVTLDLVTDELSSKIEQTENSIKQEIEARTEEGKEIKASLDLKIDKDDDGTIVSLINGTADKIHFGADNMFTVNSPNFKVDENGNVTITGKISAESGTIGNFTIDEEQGWMEYNQGGNKVCGLGARQAFYAGSGSSDNAPFHVSYNGELYAENAYISGQINAAGGTIAGGTIAGWNVTENGLSNGNSRLSNDRLVVVGIGDNNNIINFQAVPGMVTINPGDKGTINFYGIEFDRKDFEKLRIMIAQSGVVPSSTNLKPGGEYE